MQTLTLVTGSKGKLAQWQRLLPDDFLLESIAIDLPEIQTLDLKKLVADKARHAYAKVNKPVVVEDVSAGLNHLEGLPGPFIKFFEERLGQNALYKLAGREAAATVSCTIGYFDGTSILYAYGEVTGTVVAPRGNNGFGFDVVFMPNGCSQTYAEMDAADKDMISHRSLAIADLAIKLRAQSQA